MVVPDAADSFTLEDCTPLLYASKYLVGCRLKCLAREISLYYSSNAMQQCLFLLAELSKLRLTKNIGEGLRDEFFSKDLKRD